MYSLNLLLLVVYLSSALGGVLERPSNLPCKLDDSKCIIDATEWVVSTTLQGISEKGIQSMDPLYYEVLEGHLGFLKYTMKKTQIEGMKTCKVMKTSFNSNGTAMHMEFMCHRSHMDGEYNIEGELIGYPVKGNGTFDIDTTNYLCGFDTSITYYKKASKLHLKHDKYNYKCDLLGGLEIELRSLDGKPKVLSETSQHLLQLAKSNAKLFASILSNPIHDKNTKTFIKNLNKRLGLVPITDMLQINEKNVKLVQF